jgi:CBS domain-containing protein
MDLIVAIRPSYLSAPKPTMADALQYSPMFWSGLFTIQTKALLKKKVKDIMSDPPLTVDEEANLMEVADLLYARNARRLGVTRKGKIIGIVREQEIFFEIVRMALES